MHLKKQYKSRKQGLCHQLGTSERPEGADFIKNNMVGIDFIIAK